MRVEYKFEINLKMKEVDEAIQLGDILYIKTKNGIEIPFAVILIEEDRSSYVIQQIGMVEERPFQKRYRGDGKNINEYEGSGIQKYIEGEWIDQFEEEFKNKIIDKPFLLRADDYNPERTKYPYYNDRRNIIKYDKNGFGVRFWTNTPNRDGVSVRICYPSGIIANNYHANDSHGVVPACRIKLWEEKE